MVAFGLKALPSAVFLGLLSPALGCIVFTGQLYGNTRSVDNFGTAYGWMTVTDNDVEICTGNIFKGDKNLGNTVVLDSGTLQCSTSGSLNYDWTDNQNGEQSGSGDRNYKYNIPVTYVNTAGNRYQFDIPVQCEQHQSGDQWICDDIEDKIYC